MPPPSNQAAPSIARPTQQTSPRRPYSTPRLLTHGTIVELTASLPDGPGISGLTDGG
jgi:hypothetical protein